MTAPIVAAPGPRPATAHLTTHRLVLRALSPAVAADLLSGVGGPGSRWAPDYPGEADVVAATGYLWALEHVGDYAPFGPYQLVRRADGLVIGGGGFHGPPVCGEVEISYAVAPSARALGYATEAVGALVAFAAASGAQSVCALAASTNVVSQRVALAAGFDLAGPDGAFLRYTCACAEPSQGAEAGRGSGHGGTIVGPRRAVR